MVKMSKPIKRSVVLVTAAISVGALLSIFFVSQNHDPTPVVEIAASPPPTESISQSAANLDSPSEPEATTSPSVQKLEDHDKWVRDVVNKLLALDDARSLVTAAAIMHAHEPLFSEPSELRGNLAQRILDLMDRAITKAQGDPVVAILADAYCRRSTGLDCDSERFDLALQSSDAGNALAWIGSFARATSAGDRAQQETIVRQMSNAKRVDNYYREIEDLLTGAIDSARVPIPESAASDAVPATRALAARAMQFVPKLSLAPLEGFCKRSLTEELLASCQRVVDLSRDEQGNYPIDVLSLATQLSSPGSKEAQAIADTRRRREWQFIRAMSLPRTTEQTRLIAAGDNGAIIEILTANAVPLDPPPEWRP